MTALRDEAMVREMLREAWGAAYAAARDDMSGHCVDEGRDLKPTIDRILASHPAPVAAPEREGRRCECGETREHQDAHGRWICVECGTLAEAAITEALPAPAPSELLEHAVTMAMEAWVSAQQPCRICHGRQHKMDCPNSTQERAFLTAVRERLARSAQLAACNAAASTQASELMSAAEWLDKHDATTQLTAGQGECDWAALRWPAADIRGTAPSLHLAILAAARSLGWPGGGR